jgi:hypothetical protein
MNEPEPEENIKNHATITSAPYSQGIQNQNPNHEGGADSHSNSPNSSNNGFRNNSVNVSTNSNSNGFKNCSQRNSNLPQIQLLLLGMG